MLNVVILEGIVTAKDERIHSARLAVYRDENKRFRTDGREMPDFVSVRYRGDRGDDLQVGNRVVVHGFIQSRDFQEPLGRILARVGLELPDDLKEKASGMSVPRVATEVVAEKIIRVSGRNGK